METKEIRALYDDAGIVVYQAYNPAIARTALAAQTFVSPPYKRDRMTWIKPSFLWMMYRSGWASKENQERILAIGLKRSGFEWALENACLSHFDASVHASRDAWKTKLQQTPVRIQWDPEKDILLRPLPYRSIQIGLSGIAVDRYLSDWILRIDDITDHCKNIHRLINANRPDQATALLPSEKPYPLPAGKSSIYS